MLNNSFVKSRNDFEFIEHVINHEENNMNTTEDSPVIIVLSLIFLLKLLDQYIFRNTNILS